MTFVLRRKGKMLFPLLSSQLLLQEDLKRRGVMRFQIWEDLTNKQKEKPKCFLMKGMEKCSTHYQHPLEDKADNPTICLLLLRPNA